MKLVAVFMIPSISSRNVPSFMQFNRTKMSAFRKEYDDEYSVEWNINRMKYA